MGFSLKRMFTPPRAIRKFQLGRFVGKTLAPAALGVALGPVGLAAGGGIGAILKRTAATGMQSARRTVQGMVGQVMPGGVKTGLRGIAGYGLRRAMSGTGGGSRKRKSRLKFGSPAWRAKYMRRGRRKRRSGR